MLIDVVVWILKWLVIKNPISSTNLLLELLGKTAASESARAGSPAARELAGKLADQPEALLGELEMRVPADSTRPHDFSV